MTQLPPHLRSKVLGAAKTAPAGPTRDVWQRNGILTVAFAHAVSLGIFFAVGGLRPGERPLAYIAGVGLGFAAVTLVTAYFSLQRGGSSLGRPVTVLASIAAAVPLLLAVVSVAGRFVWPESRFADDDRSDLRCAMYAGIFGVVPLAAFLWSRRHIPFVRPFWVSAAAGATSFAFGSLLITLRCTCATLDHMMLGHVVPVALFGALGGLLGAKILGTGVTASK